MERFTITKTHRWGNADTRISHVYSAARRDVKKDDVIRIANQMIESDYGIQMENNVTKTFADKYVVYVTMNRLANGQLLGVKKKKKKC